jgi:perosamine synthetase
MTIPLLQPSITDAEIEAVTKVLRSRWWGQGRVVEQFERELADRYEYAHCVTTNSATAALHLALHVLGIGSGSEVILPALTFVSTGLAVLYTGAKPILADVYPDTLCLDWNDALSKVSEKTCAIMPVDYAGFPAWTNDKPYITAIPIVQDAAHSCGGRGYGDLVCLSFHPVKNLATGDGGAILTNDADQAERLRSLRWCGIDRSTWERSEKRYGWDYDISEMGFKYHWNDIQAAIGLVQLGRLDAMNERRREIAEKYCEELCGVVELPHYVLGHTRHLFPIRVDAEQRDLLIDYLLSKDISAGVHYKPLSHYPMFDGYVPVTEREWRRLVSLPIFPDMLLEFVHRGRKTLFDLAEMEKLTQPLAIKTKL